MRASPEAPCVLVVDDNQLFANLLKRALARLGIHNVSEARTGRRALELLSSTADGFDLMLCDLDMPEMDGVQLLRHLSEENFGGSLVLVSGRDPRIIDSVAGLARQYGLRLDGVLHKPFAITALTEILKNIAEPRSVLQPPSCADITAKELAQAIARKQIVVHYQPQMEIESGRITGVEALARWQHPDKGTISPGVFIPLAESTALITPLTDLVLAQVIEQASRWRKIYLEMPIAINSPSDMLVDLQFADTLDEFVTSAGIAPELITLEITETQFMADLRKGIETVNRLRLKGYRLSIDDFGTGYSSLAQLQQVPAQELKIDRNFVLSATHDSVARAIVETSAELARRLSMTVVAEGVESAGHLDLVRRAGCKVAQGFYIAGPMSARHFERWLEQRANFGVGLQANSF